MDMSVCVVVVVAVITCPALNASALHPALRVKDAKLSGYRPGDQARFHCAPGYRLDSSTRRRVRCRDPGRWDSDPPSCYRLYCRRPPTVDHARVLGRVDRTEAGGGHVVYRCDEGYRLGSADGRLECGYDGNWVVSTLPSCVRVTCSVPPAAANGSRRYERPPVAGSSATYMCLAGFVIVGEPEMGCTDAGLWNGTAPACVPISCPPPRGIPHGTVAGNQFTYLSSVRYSCDAGFVLAGGDDDRTSVTRKCTESGEWKPELPVCRRRPCPAVASIEHGRTVSHGDPVYGSVVEFVCDAGFRLEGRAELTCVETGRWSDAPPRCATIFCPPPEPVANGTAVGTVSIGSVYRPGSVVRYRCDAGFEVRGKTTRSCRGDGSWSGPKPRCDVVRCRPPNSIRHGRLSLPTAPDSTVYGTKVEYRCDPGYQLDGPAVRTCSDGSRWSGSDPECQPTACDDPAPMRHGTVVGLEREVGAEVEYRCDDGYRIVGDAVRNCTRDGEWSGDGPYCEEQVECDKPSDVISNGRMVSANFSAGATIRYVCDDGYFVDGPTNRTCQEDGSWDSPIPVCERVECPRPPKPAHSRVEGFEYRFEERVTYACRAGYKLIGPDERICLANRTWSGTEPKCEPIACRQPSNLTNGRIVVEGLSYRSVVRYLCDSGYRLEGPRTRECGENGTWTGLRPECTEITCSQPPSIEFGSTLSDRWNPGDEVQYACDDGYRLSQSDRLVCSETGSFTGASPICVKIECAELRSIPDGSVDAPGSNLDDVAKFTCRRGFELVGPEELVCTDNGTWSALPPSCVRVTCPPPDYVPDAVIQSTGYEFESIVQYECVGGFELESGNLSRECSWDGRWSGTSPVCLPAAECPEPDLVHGFVASTAGDRSVVQHVVDVNRFVAGVVVDFDCEEGFRLVGERTVACLDNSTWSSALPTCVRVGCPQPSVNNSILVAPNGFAYGFRVLIECEQGFELVGSSEASCRSDGSWSTAMPECRQLVCEEPASEAELEIDVVSTPNDRYRYPVGVVVGFRCKDGYTLDGESNATCREDQSWSAVSPACAEVSCSPPLTEPKDNNTSPRIDNYEDAYRYGETISFSCPGDEYRLLGSSELVCDDRGRWNGSVPSCQLLRCPPMNAENGKIVATSGTSLPYNAVGSRVRVRCDDGYRVSSTAATAACALNGSWSNDLTTACQKTLCPTPTVINGRATVARDRDEPAELAVGVEIVVSCDGGFLLPVGAPRSIECTESGHWSEMLPTCIRVSCPPVDVEGARVHLNGTAVENSSAMYWYGDVVEVECMIGHSLVGHGSLTCQSTGAWSHRLPACEPVHCPEPGVPHASVHVFGLPSGASFNYTFGVVVYFVCDDGFDVVGPTENLCLDDGTWDAPFPRCERKLCPQLSVPHADVDYPDREYGARVRVSCDDGYELFGDAILVCQASARWSGVRPVCVRILCKLPSVADARIVGGSSEENVSASDGSTMSYGDAIEVQCRGGFELVGESRLVCGTNKTWSPEAPRCRRVHCSDPLSSPVPHLTLDVRRPDGVPDSDTRQFVYGTEVEFDCELGFRRVGAASVSCNETAQWSGSDVRPACETVYCPPPPRISHGRPTSGDDRNHTFGDSVTFGCDAGFVLRGEAEVFCQPNGEWTGAFPVCERRACPPAPSVDHGSVYAAPTSPEFQDVVVYRCETGYDLVGGNNATCGADGRWTRRPSCLLVRCPPPESVPHGTYMPTGSTYGSVLRYACNRGYELHGDADHMCRANGSWSGQVPACRPISCRDPPPRVPHADLVGRAPTQFGGRLAVSCREGYRLVGPPSVECLWNGSWSRVVSSCDVVTCGPPPYVRHARAAGPRRRHEYNSTVRYACNTGYRLSGPTNASLCLANGSWSQVDVRCVVITCATPAIPDGGQIMLDRGHPVRDLDRLEELRPDGFQYGDRVRVSCDPDRELRGAGFRVCGADGRWNGTEPECRRITCRRPPALLNVVYDDRAATSDSREFYVGHTLDLSCKVGFHIVQDHDIIVCQVDRSWNTSFSLSPCRRTVCSLPPGIPRGHFVVTEGGRLSDDLFDFGTAVSYSCQPGYLLVGEREATCGDDASWSNAHSPPFCAVVNCSSPDPPDNGRAASDEGLSFGSAVDFHCDRGYRLIGASRLICRHDGYWNGSTPACRIVSCGPPPRLPNASVSANSTAYGSVARYHCRSGFEHASGSDVETRTCGSDGVWTAAAALSCRKVACPDPSRPQHGDYSGSASTFDAVVTYRCDRGYKLVGERRRRCRADRTWSGSVPACERQRCPPPSAPINGRIGNAGATAFPGSVVEFDCDAGHRLVGSRAVRCTDREVWNAAFPRCEPVSCGRPPDVEHADVDARSFSYGDVARYACRPGYERSGPGTVRCLADGRWASAEDAATVCERVRCGDPPPVAHASAVADGSGRRYGDVVYYACADGYELSGNNLLECGADARWSGSLPRCDRVTCGPVPVIAHATTIVRRTTLGSRASYHCNRGYTLAGSPYVECRPNRTWAYTDRPSCLPVDCGPPPQPTARGTAVRHGATAFNDSAVYYCLDGFRFADGTSTTRAVCGEDGNWNATAGSGPACRPVPCPEPRAPADGRVRVVRDDSPQDRGGVRDAATYGDDAEFSCDVGYQLIGDVTVTCQSDGTWSGTDEPVCRRKTTTFTFAIQSRVSITFYIVCSVNAA